MPAPELFFRNFSIGYLCLKVGSLRPMTFFHRSDVPFCFLLARFPSSDPDRPPLFAGYRPMLPFSQTISLSFFLRVLSGAGTVRVVSCLCKIIFSFPSTKVVLTFRNSAYSLPGLFFLFEREPSSFIFRLWLSTTLSGLNFVP